MNVENIKKVENWLANIPRFQGFNMAAWYEQHGCHTVMCIGGFAQAQALKEPEFANIAGCYARANSWLGLEDEVADRLFHPHGDVEWVDITPGQALAVLKNLRETGKVEWERICNEQ